MGHKIVVHIQDSRYNGIRPSHFDGIRMACDAFGVETLEYIDLDEDEFYAPGGQTRHASFDDFVAAHPGEKVCLLDPDGEDLSKVGAEDWLVVGPAGGFTTKQKAAHPSVNIAMAVPTALEARDALMVALARI